MTLFSYVFGFLQGNGKHSHVLNEKSIHAVRTVTEFLNVLCIPKSAQHELPFSSLVWLDNFSLKMITSMQLP